MTDYLNTGDGIFTALRIIESTILTNNWDLEIFNKTPQVLINVPNSLPQAVIQKSWKADLWAMSKYLF